MGPRVRRGSKKCGLFRGVEKWVRGRAESKAQIWLLHQLLRAIAGQAGGSALGRLQAPESWEVADLDVATSRLMLPSSSPNKNSISLDHPVADAVTAYHFLFRFVASASSALDRVSEDAINPVDRFLREEALHNPGKRLSSNASLLF
ncbi:R3H domain-containing protein 2-like [Cucumis melo var. makuwa]|uniref:R3H domain-containing protein 2-like n=1 Tax=Cucumis melo var. makuwa TaxID=1194695 RepID=A0A5D3CQ27_CUCMM|nr:R3H domain-containing protein 2-like [Cucumis melo var. makuwa]TYK12526.1 R3H domain-containing protein 2-like [Cucumis melo var. makuwa]